MFAMRVLEFGALIVLLLLAVATAQVTHPNEVRALKDIRKKLKDPMKNLNSWKRGDPCESNWTGVVCFDMPINMTLNESVPNDGYQHIKELNMLNMNLSGSLSPQIGELSYLQILDFMWNNVRGSIPKEIGNIKSLQLLVLNGNQLTGSLPEELGFLPVLRRIQIDENNISGPIPKTFANLNRTRHFHMNNNSLSGQIPSELSRLPRLVHFLLDNNNLSGPLPPEFSELPELLIMQLDNNHLDGTIPASYGNMKKLLKLSLRNCNLQGAVPDLSRIPQLGYLDLSWNRLSGPMPSNKLSENITTIDLSYNNLSGPFPANFSGLPRLQRLSLENNSFGGDVPSTIWLNRTFNGTERLQLDFQNNKLSNISDIFPPANVSIRLEGNPVCEGANQLNVIQFCKSQTGVQEVPRNSTNTEAPCSPCPQYYEYVENAPGPCFCAAPLGVGYRLKSPGFTDFLSYESQFEYYMAGGTAINLYQLSIASFAWEKGPRLEMYLKFFPEFNGMNNTFNESEIRRITGIFKEWKVPDSDIFGPYELISFILLGPYEIKILDFSESGISKGALAGIVLGVVACAIIMCAILSKVILRRCAVKQHAVTRKRLLSRASMKIDGVKDFTFKEMALATSNFNDSAEIGQGGYGKVYKGVLTDGTVVAVKRALEESLQGVKEFMTEITLLSRVHHRNLVSLIGFCDDKDEQMLVYEYMPNGTLRDCLSGEPMGFAMRLRIALASAKGILYLHTEADPPIFHRDIKTSNILLDSKFTAKVADFGLSKLAPVPDLKGATPGHVSTVAKGTPGYLDPEYFLTQKLTDKSDVYSLGVVFLELLTGMQPISHGKNIVREVYLAYNAGLIFSVVDERMGSYPSEGVERFMTLALSCCEDDTDSRPSMAHVVRELEKIWTMMPDSETEPSDSDIKEPIKGNPQSSKSATKDLYTSSSDISGSNLVSGVIPIVSPR